jgi:hypothetical protein
MRTMLNKAVFLGVFLGSACVAHAGDSGNHTIKATSFAKFDDIKGQYDLANGRTLTISGSARRVLAQLDGGPQTVLVPSDNAVFTAQDGSFMLTFVQHENGSVSGVTLHPALTVAGSAQVGVVASTR